MNNKLTITKVIDFFKALKGDEITFETSHCGTYTDLYSEIFSVGISTLRVKVNSSYTNPDCVDNNNLTDVSIESIRVILNKTNQIEEFEIDGKILALEAFIKKHPMTFNHSDQNKLETLLERFNSFYSQILLEKTINNNVNKIERFRFNSLFIDL